MIKAQIYFMIFIGVLAHATPSFGYSRPEDCTFQITHRDNLQFSRQYKKDRAECWHSVHPRNGYETLTYRSYLLTSDGMLFIFNSFGNGNEAKTTGARAYYFFPREDHYISEAILTDEQAAIRLNSKLTLRFETKNLYVLNNESLVVKNYTSINPKNAGGVEVLRYNGVYLDAGFMLGKSTTSVPTLKSMFKNQFGQKCSVQNQVIFDYKEGDAILKHDTVLHRIVAAQCPKFRWKD